MNPDFALHIDCYKIITWLDERKKLVKDWQTYLKAAETQIASLLERQNLLKEYPHIAKYLQEHEESTTVVRLDFTYTDVVCTIAELEKTPLGQQKSFLGQYTNPLMKDWSTLRRFMSGKLTGVLMEGRFINQVLKFEM
jgi:hypothetical protein